MKKLLWLLATALTLIFATGCEDKGDNDINPNNPSTGEEKLYYYGAHNENIKREGGWKHDVSLNYTSNVECELLIPDDAPEWISVPEATKAVGEMTPTSAVVTVAANNSGEERSAVVYVVAVDNPSLILEYTIKQNPRYVIKYTTTDERVLDIRVPNTINEVTMVSNTYEDGVGYLDFDKPITKITLDRFAKMDNLETVIIPEGVVEIANGAFEELKWLKSVTLPSTLTTIREEAFKNCERLESINLPESLTTIESGVFQRCNLTEVALPSGLTEIAHSLFFGCKNLTKVSIPNSVTSIGMSVFVGCEKLADVTIPDGVTYLGNSAFEGCKSIGSIVVPGGVYTVYADTFKGCLGLRNVTLSEGVASIGTCAFQDCRNVKIDVPSSVIDISSGAFWNCSGELEINSKIVENDYEKRNDGYAECGYEDWLLCADFSKIVLGENITKIGNYALGGKDLSTDTDALKEVVINGKVTSIGDGAFENCSELTEITIPESVTSIGKVAFRNCGVKTVYCKPQTPPSCVDKVFYSAPGLKKVYVPRQSVEAYKSVWNWGILPQKIEGYDF